MGFVVQDGFEFFFFAKNGPESLGVIERKAALLNSGVAFEGQLLAGGGIRDLDQAKLVAVHVRDFGNEVEGVDWVLRRMGEKPGDVKDAALVFEVGVVAIES